jgi:hypothetical protein
MSDLPDFENIPGFLTIFGESELRLALAIASAIKQVGGGGGGGGGGSGDASAANQVIEINRLTEINNKTPALGGQSASTGIPVNITSDGLFTQDLLARLAPLVNGRVPVVLPASSGSNPLLGVGTIPSVTTINTVLADGNFDTYSRLSFHLRGTWGGTVRCEMSGDNLSWNPVPVYYATSGENFLDIKFNGIYTVNAHARYFRLITTTDFSGSINGDYGLSTDDKSIEHPDKKLFAGSALTNTAGNVLVSGNCENYNQISFTTFGTFAGAIRLQGTNRPEDSASWRDCLVKNLATNVGNGGDWGSGAIQIGDLYFSHFRIAVTGTGTGTVSVVGLLKKSSIPGNSLSVDTELNALSLIDNLGAQTQPLVGGINYLFNNSSLDRARSLGNVSEGLGRAKVSNWSSGVSLATVSATGTSTSLDLAMSVQSVSCQITIPGTITDFESFIEGSLNNTEWDILCTIPRNANGVRPATGTIFNVGNNQFSRTKDFSVRYLRVRTTLYTGTGNIIYLISVGTDPVITPHHQTRSEAATSIANTLTTTSALIAPANLRRKGLVIYNSLSTDVFIALFPGATNTSYSYRLLPNEQLEIPYNYTGDVYGLTSSGSGSIQITGLT